MKKSDTIVIQDRTGRRAFFRAGAAFVLAGSAIAQGQAQAQGARFDCDSLGFSGEKNPETCLLYTSPSPRDQRGSRMPSSA